jgi:methylmalonyl-CoA mutase cobalamin-binding subunit
MFRWCAYCQRLIGEVAPFDDFRISHGICKDCAGRMEEGELYPVKGLELFKKLFDAARGEDFDACHRYVDEALGLGWSPSDAAIGLLQPALYEFGVLWEKGVATLAEERRFSAWCDRALTLLEHSTPRPPGRCRVLFATRSTNEHTLGPRIAALRLRDRGISAWFLPAGISDDEILDACKVEKPEILGLSAAVGETLPGIRALAARAAKLPRPPRVVVGGQAARLPQAADLERIFTAEELESLLRR